MPSPIALSIDGSVPGLATLVSRLCTHFLHLHEESCSRGQPLLTADGISFFQILLSQSSHESKTQQNAVLGKLALVSKPLPSWDPDSRCLWLGAEMIKHFRQPAPNQIAILDVFEEDGWANLHIDDPLPGDVDMTEEDAKRRLHDTLHNLNRGLPAGTIRFRGDGTGQGVSWEYDFGDRRNCSRVE